MVRLRLPAVALLCAAIALIAGPAAAASTLGISPIRIDLEERRPTAALRLENTGEAAMVVQLQLMRWSAAGADDAYEQSDELIATPPVMTIRPGAPQIVRVGLAGGADPLRERAYRLYVEEVPPPPEPGYQGLQVALRIGVPVFVAPATVSAQPAVHWRAVRAEGGGVRIRAINGGNAHLRLLSLTVADAGGTRVLATRPIVGYLLPDQFREWPVALDGAAGEERLRLSVATHLGTIDVDVEVEDR